MFYINTMAFGKISSLFKEVAAKLTAIEPLVGRCYWKEDVNGFDVLIEPGATPEMIDGMLDQMNLIRLVKSTATRTSGTG